MERTKNITFVCAFGLLFVLGALVGSSILLIENTIVIDMLGEEIGFLVLITSAAMIGLNIALIPSFTLLWKMRPIGFWLVTVLEFIIFLISLPAANVMGIVASLPIFLYLLTKRDLFLSS